MWPENDRVTCEGTPVRTSVYVNPQLPGWGGGDFFHLEGDAPGRAVNMDPNPIPSFSQAPSILDEELFSSWSMNDPTYSYNHQVDAEARSLVGCGAPP